MKKNKQASTFIEYAILLGVLIAVVMAMNTYIKRGLQGSLKDVTDTLISNRQVAEIYNSASVSNSTDVSTVITGMSTGGKTSTAILDNRQIHATSNFTDEEK